MASSRHAKDCVDDAGEGARIVITHYTNPHMFWFYDLDSQHKNLKLRSEIEDAVAHYVQERHTRNTKMTDFNKGDIVAFKYLAFQKYIRARIDFEYESPAGQKYIVWALDYGFPILTHSRNMFRLPPELTKRSGIIKRGGLAAIPAKGEYNAFTSKWQVVPQVKWSATACNDLRELLDKSKSVRFFPSFHTKPKSEKHYWGDLELDIPGEKTNASDFLVKWKNALKDGYVSKYRDAFASKAYVDAISWNDHNNMFNGKENIEKTVSMADRKVDFDTKLIGKSQKKVHRWFKRYGPSCSKQHDFEEIDNDDDFLPIPYSKGKRLAFKSFKPVKMPQPSPEDFNITSAGISMAEMAIVPHKVTLEYLRRPRAFELLTKNISLISSDESDKGFFEYSMLQEESFHEDWNTPQKSGHRKKEVSSEKTKVDKKLNNGSAAKEDDVYDVETEKRNEEFSGDKLVKKLSRCTLKGARKNRAILKKPKCVPDFTKERRRFPAGYDFSREMN